MDRNPLLAAALLLCLPVCAAAQFAAPPAKAVRYHSVLVKRPGPGYLFDRFYNAWLDEQSAESLEQFLRDQTKQDAPADHLLLAVFYARQGDEAKALAEYKIALEDDPENSAAWFEKATLEARTLNLEAALADLERAAEGSPSNELRVRIAKLRGQLLMRAGRREEALTAFRSLTAKNPQDQQLAEDVIEMLIAEGMHTEAIKDSTQLIERTSDPYRKVMRQLRLGDIHQMTGDRNAAVEVLRSTLSDVGVDSWIERQVLAQIEECFSRNGNLASLKKEYEGLLEKFPRRVGVRRGYARLLAQAGDSEQAIEQFKEILRITPGDRENQQAFITLLAACDKTTQATEQLRSLIKQNPGDPELYVQLAELCATSEDEPAARKAVQSFLQASDKREYSYVRAARLLERLDLKDAAREQYAALTDAFPDSPSAKEAHAAFLYKSGDKPAAIAMWKASAENQDAAQAVRTARALAARQEHEAAYELLAARQESFRSDPVFLAQIVEAATALKKYEQAVPLSLRRVELSTTPATLDDAISQAVRAIDRADRLPAEIEKLKASSQLTPQRACLLAELLERQGDTQQADAVLTPLIAQGNLLAASQQVSLARGRRDWKAAIKAAEQLLGMPGGRKSRTVQMLVELNERDFNLDQAIEWTAEWKKLSPGSTMPWLAESRLLIAKGQNDQAIEVLRRAVREFNNAPELRSRLAHLYESLGKLADAERLYRRELDDSQDLIERLRVVEQLARIARQQGEADKLVEEFEERRRENRASVEPLMALAAIHRVLDNHEAQIKVLGEASRLRPDDTELLLQIARIEEREGDWNKAIDTLKRAMELDPSGKSKQALARLHLSMGNLDEGYRLLTDIPAAEADARKVESLAEAMISNQEWERAAEFLAPFRQRWPDDYRLQFLYGLVLEETNELDRAVDQFLAILNKSQAPSTQPAATLTPQQTYYKQLAGIAPAGVGPLLESATSHHYAYQYQKLNRQASMVGFAAGAGLGLSMPTDLHAAHLLSIAHLANLSSLVDERQAADIKRRVARSGLEDADVLLLLGGEPRDRSAMIAEALASFPDRDSILGFAILSGLRMPALDNAFYAQAFDRFEERYPELALFGYVNGILAGYADVVEEQRACDLLRSIDSPPAMFVAQLTSAYSRAGSRGQAPLPEAFSKQLRDWVVERYATLQDTTPYGAGLFNQVAAILRQEEEPHAFVRLLDEEVRHSRDRGQLNQANYQTNASWLTANPRASVQSFLIPPPFPPAVTRDFPANVLAQARAVSHHSANPYPVAQPVFSVGARAQPAPQWDRDAMRQALGKAKDPLLRLLLAADLDDDAASRAAAELLRADMKSPDALLALSGWAATHGRPEQAADYLQRARDLPMDRQMRGIVDSYLIGLALMESNRADQTPAREAAVRLSHHRLQPQQATKLSAAMIELGMQKEAEALDAKATAAQLAARGAPFNQSPAVRILGNRGQLKPRDRIRQLLERKQNDVAVRLLAREVLMEVRQLARQQGNLSYQRRKQQAIAQRVHNYGLTDELLASFEPGDSDHHLKHGSYALVLEALGRPEQAYKAYQRALELRPQDDEYRVRLIQLDMERGRLEQAISRCSNFRAHGESQLTMQLVNVFQNREFTLDQQLDYAKLGLHLLQDQLATGNGDASWSLYFRHHMASALSLASKRYPSLYSRASGPFYRREGGEDREQTDAYHRRRSIHDEFCRAMLRTPSLASDGFAGLLAAHEAAGQSTAQFTEIAKDILMAPAAPPAVGRYSSFSVSTAAGGDLIGLRTPEEYFVRACWESGNLEPVAADVLTHLRKVGRLDSQTLVQGYYQLYSCPSDEFLNAARTFVRQSVSRAAPGVRAPYPEMVVHQVWEDRGLDIDVNSLMLTSLRDWMSTPTGNAPPPYLMAYLKSLAKREGSRAGAEWLEQIATVMVGPLKGREKRIAATFQPNTWSTGTPNAAMHQFANFVNQSVRDADLLIPTLRFLSQGKVAPLTPNLDSTVQSGIRKALAGDAEKSIAFLDELGLLGDSPDFELQAYGLNQGQTTLLLAVGAQLRSHRQKAQVEAMLDERGDVLGPRLIRCAMSLNPQKFRELLTFVGKRIDHFRSLDASKQRAIGRELDALVVAINLSSQEDLATLQGELRAALDWVQEQNAARSQHLFQRITDAKRFEELGVPINRLDQWLSEELAGLSAADPAAAADAYFHVAELYDQAAARNAVNRRYYPTTAQGLANSLLQRLPYNSAEKANLCIALMEHSNDQLVSRRNEVEQGLSVIRQQYSTIYSQSRQQKQDAAWRVDQYLEWTREKIAKHDSMLLVVPFVQALESHGRGDLEEIIGRLKELERDAVADTLLHAAQYVRQQNYRRQPNHTPDETVYESLSARLRDDEQPLSSRIVVGHFFGERQRDNLPLGMRRALLQVLREVAESQAPLQQSEHRAYVINLAWLAERGHFPDEVTATVDAWVQRYVLDTSRLLAGYGANAGQPDSPNDVSSEVQMLDVCYRLGRDRDAQRLLLRYTNELSNRQETIAALTHAGEIEKAAALSRAAWRQFSPHELSPPPVYFDTQLAENLPKLLEQLGQGPHAPIVKAALQRLPDSPEDQPEGFVTRENRLARLADEFDREQLSTAGAPTLYLTMLRDSDTALEKLSEEVQREVDAINLEKLAMVNAPLDAAAELMAAHAHWQIKQGDPSGAMKLILQVVKGTPRSQRNNYYYHLTNIFGRHSYRIGTQLKKHAEQFDAEDWETISHALRSCYEIDSHVSLHSNRDLLTLLVIAEAKTREPNEFAAWTQRIPSRFRKQIQRTGLSHDVWSYAFAGIDSDGADASRSRAILAARMLDRMQPLGMIEAKDLNGVGMRINYGLQDFSNLERALKPEGLEQLPAASEAAEQQELIWLLYASSLKGKGKHQEAIDAWGHAFEATPESNHDRRFEIRAEQLDTLLNNNLRKRAQELWKQTPAEKIPSRLKSRYNKIESRIEQEKAEQTVLPNAAKPPVAF